MLAEPLTSPYVLAVSTRLLSQLAARENTALFGRPAYPLTGLSDIAPAPTPEPHPVLPHQAPHKDPRRHTATRRAIAGTRIAGVGHISTPACSARRALLSRAWTSRAAGTTELPSGRGLRAGESLPRWGRSCRRGEKSSALVWRFCPRRTGVLSSRLYWGFSLAATLDMPRDEGADPHWKGLAVGESVVDFDI